PDLPHQLVDMDGYRSSFQLDNDMLTTGGTIADVNTIFLFSRLQLGRVGVEKILNQRLGVFGAFGALPSWVEKPKMLKDVVPQYQLLVVFPEFGLKCVDDSETKLYDLTVIT